MNSVLVALFLVPPVLAQAECSNTCHFSFDGDCDDGGHGSDYSYCQLGTDCADCGVRYPLWLQILIWVVLVPYSISSCIWWCCYAKCCAGCPCNKHHPAYDRRLAHFRSKLPNRLSQRSKTNGVTSLYSSSLPYMHSMMLSVLKSSDPNAGLGIWVRDQNGKCCVEGVDAGLAGALAGLMVGDQITQVDGKVPKGASDCTNKLVQAPQAFVLRISRPSSVPPATSQPPFANGTEVWPTTTPPKEALGTPRARIEPALVPAVETELAVVGVVFEVRSGGDEVRPDVEAYEYTDQASVATNEAQDADQDADQNFLSALSRRVRNSVAQIIGNGAADEDLEAADAPARMAAHMATRMAAVPARVSSRQLLARREVFDSEIHAAAIKIQSVARGRRARREVRQRFLAQRMTEREELAMSTVDTQSLKDRPKRSFRPPPGN